MPDPALKKALLTALRVHEIGSKSPYQLFFAKKGKSGASFGFMQGDLAAGQAVAKNTFHDVLEAAGFAAGSITSLTKRLSVHLLLNPLTKDETTQVNAALDSKAGRKLVDAMDEQIAAQVLEDLDLCIGSAMSANRQIAPAAQLYMVMWINMTGKPTKLLTWLKGGDPNLTVKLKKLGSVVDVAAIEAYLKATDYYTQNPQNFAHLQESAAAGIAKLP